MAKEKKFSADDIEVLGNAEIRHRKGQPTCTNCFLKAPLGVDENGHCVNCADTSVSFISHRDPDESYVEYNNKTIEKGPRHSPAYLASCEATGLVDQRGPHPQAQGVLPTNHTRADFEHYVTARGGHIDEFGDAYIDNRTAEQRDPNHRLYSDTPLLVKVKSVPVQTYLPKEAIETAKVGPKIIDKEGRMPSTGFPNTWQEEWTMSPEGNTFKEYRDGLRESTLLSLSPEERHEHQTMHVSPRKNYPNTVDHKGNFWTSEPDTCASCNLDNKINEAAFAHPNHGIKAEDPLCPNC